MSRLWGILRTLSGHFGIWKTEFYVLYLAVRDGRTPLLPKLIAVMLAGYLISPVDLLSDFIPLLGYIDDAVAVPLGTTLALRLVPPPVLADCRRHAALNPLSTQAKKWAVRVLLAIIGLTIALNLLWHLLPGRT